MAHGAAAPQTRKETKSKDILAARSPEMFPRTQRGSGGRSPSGAYRSWRDELGNAFPGPCSAIAAARGRQGGGRALPQRWD